MISLVAAELGTPTANPALNPYGISAGTMADISSVVEGEGSFLGNYFFWTTALLLGGGISYYLSRDKALSLLLRDRSWVSNPKSFGTMLRALGVKICSLGNDRLYSFEDKLPSLPVPDLDETCKTYLSTVKPFLSGEDFGETQRVVEEFKNGEGISLQKELVEIAKKERNWLETWWDEKIYLSSRMALPISTNWYGISSTPERIDHSDPQVGRASQMIKGILDFKKRIDNKTYETINAKCPFPISMEQYKRLFGTTRIPGSPVDTIETYPHSKHIVVLANNRAYPMSLYDRGGNELSLEEFDRLLAAIKKDAQSGEGDISEVNYLTSQDRDSWAKDRKDILDSGIENKDSLKTIEEALFVLAFDDTTPENLEELSKGAFLGLRNRWYDKGMQVVVFENGQVGYHMEHSGCEATIPASMLEEVLRNEDKYSARDTSTVSREFPAPWPLQWNISADLNGRIQEAKGTLAEQMGDYDLKTLEFGSLGKEFIQKNHCSPDGFVQMALQLAYYKLNQRYAMTYETSTARVFYHGRTETIRSVSDASSAFVEAMMNEKSSDKKKELLEAALSHHAIYKQKGYLAQGVDRHLLGLRILAEQKGINLEIFNDKAYKLPWTLSTSQTPCSNFPGGGFSPPEVDGYGIAYVVNKSELIFHVTSKKSCETSSSEQFLEALGESLGEMKKLYFDPKD